MNWCENRYRALECMVWFHSHGMTMVWYDYDMVWLHSYHSKVVWDSHSIWYGMVWVWYGMIPLWYGLIPLWYGMSMVWYDYSMVWFHSHGMTIVWYDYGMTWLHSYHSNVVWYDSISTIPMWYGISVPSGMTFPFQCGMVSHSIWYGNTIPWWYEISYHMVLCSITDTTTHDMNMAQH